MAGSLLLSGDKRTSRRRWVIVAAVFAVVALLLFTATSHYRPPPLRPPHPFNHPSTAQSAELRALKKPKDVPIVGLIFYGRKSRVEILKCYVEVGDKLQGASSKRGKLISSA